MYRHRRALVVVLVAAVQVVTLTAWASAQRAVRHQHPPAGLVASTDADFPVRHSDREELGRLLFFDKILSGNRDTSCATCHHPLTASADALSLSLGQGAVGLGPARGTGGQVPERVPRNAPALFNLGAAEFVRMFHDGRVEVDPGEPGGFRSPAGALLPDGLDGPLAVQALFPPTSNAEMAGDPGENPVADMAAAEDLTAVWNALAGRLREIPEYVERFVASFDDVDDADDVTIVHAANAIAAFEAAAFRADDSRFDRWLRGDRNVLRPDERQGLRLFYGRAGCASCHAGTFQTDHSFHAVGMPQIGPGKGDDVPGTSGGLDDFGRERVTGDETDRFRFRTPSLRNVVWTGPWGHDGAYDNLETMVRHQLDAWVGLETYDPGQAVLPPDPLLAADDFTAHLDPIRRAAIAERIEIPSVGLSDREIQDLLAFLETLTDPSIAGLRHEIPATVPSGLPVAD